MEECFKKVYNKKTENAIETQYKTAKKTLKAYIETNKNNKSPPVKQMVTFLKKMLKRTTLKKKNTKRERRLSSGLL